MRNFVLFAAAVAVFVVIGIDTWLCIRTITPAALADSTFNPLATTIAKGPASIADDYSLAPH
jgi:hypothetical protein